MVSKCVCIIFLPNLGYIEPKFEQFWIGLVDFSKHFDFDIMTSLNKVTVYINTYISSQLSRLYNNFINVHGLVSSYNTDFVHL